MDLRPGCIRPRCWTLCALSPGCMWSAGMLSMLSVCQSLFLLSFEACEGGVGCHTLTLYQSFYQGPFILPSNVTHLMLLWYMHHQVRQFASIHVYRKCLGVIACVLARAYKVTWIFHYLIHMLAWFQGIMVALMYSNSTTHMLIGVSFFKHTFKPRFM